MKSRISSLVTPTTVISPICVTSVRPGILLGGKYRLVKPIGEGGMGWVWRAEQVHWGAPVAVKLIQPQPSPGQAKLSADQSEQRLRRFLVEAKTAAAIRSPHVVQILDHGVDPELNWSYIVMELLEGETLESRLARCGRLTGDETVRVMLQVAKALSRVHEANLVHRDLKPSNVFLVHNDGEDVVKVLDFGIAKAGPSSLADAPITVTGQQLGTPVYMSPEQIRGMPDVDFRADLWAFGVIAYECLVGERPFNGETLGDLSLKICAEPIPRPSASAPLPTAFDEWFWRCVNRERQFTFTSAREAAERLEWALAEDAAHRHADAHSAPAALPSTGLSGSRFDATTVAATSTSQLPIPVRPRDDGGGARWKTFAVVISLTATVGALLASRRDPAASDPATELPSAQAASLAATNAPTSATSEPTELAVPPPLAASSTGSSTEGLAASEAAPRLSGVATATARKPSLRRPPPTVTVGVPSVPAPQRSLDDLIEDRH